MKAVFNFFSKIVGIKTTVYKEGSTYMVKDELIFCGFVVGTDTRKASEIV